VIHRSADLLIPRTCNTQQQHMQVIASTCKKGAGCIPACGSCRATAPPGV
jgi:hypothetical protein